MATTDETISVGSIRIRFLLEGSATGGAVAMFRFDVPAGAKVPAAHSHGAYDETIYGLEGTLVFTIGGIRTEVREGEVAYIPRGVVHRFDNEGDVDASGLTVVTPALLGPEYFREIGAVLASGGPPDPAAIAAVMRRHGLTPAP